MRGKYRPHHILEVVLLFIALAGFSASNSKANENSKYLDAVSKFADNVLRLGKDTYGPKHTPLFVDGLNIHTHEPVKWIAPSGEKWVLSNLASQQNLFRTLDGLTKITGDPKYRQAAVEAIEYAFENLQADNGLLYWGVTAAYDASTDTVYGNLHCMKGNHPYYELMWEVDPQTTSQFIEAFWSAHILDWSNLDMDRYTSMRKAFKKPWDYEYEGGPVFFKSKNAWAGSFDTTASDLYHAAGFLFKVSGQKEPLIWGKRLAHRYVETRNPKTGISGWRYSCSRSKKLPPVDESGNWILDFSTASAEPNKIREAVLGRLVLSPGVFTCGKEVYTCQLMLGEMLGDDGKEFKQWALEELTAIGRAAYRQKDNLWIPMRTDGTSLEGVDGKVAWTANPADFWAYALAYRLTDDQFMWQMVRNIGRGNGFGDIGTNREGNPSLRLRTDCSNPCAILGFLELYRGTQEEQFLEMARRIGNNILAAKFHRGFFVPSKKHTYAKFDAIESLVLLHLHIAVRPEDPKPPQVWPSRVHFNAPYRQKEEGTDNKEIYALVESVEPPVSLDEAATMGNLELVKSLISHGTDVDAKDRLGRTAFSYAAENGHKDVVEILLAKGVEIDERDGFGRSALYYATRQGHKETAEFFIVNGADVNAKDNAGETPLHHAARTGRKDTAELLIAKGADINAKNNNGQTPVDIALSKNRNEVMRLLVEKGADVSLHVAVRLGYLAKVERLVQERAYINAKNESGQTALHYAARIGRKDIAELLIAKGADVNAENNNGQTPVDVAASRNRREVVKLLIEKGADVSIHVAAYLGDLARLMNCIEQGSDVNTKNQGELTPLHYATRRGHPEIVKVLLANGADVDVRDRAGRTSAERALLDGHSEIVELLVSNGADVYPLYLAISVRDLEKVRRLIRDGADVNKLTYGTTAIYIAAIAGFRDITELLIDKGADVNAGGSWDWTPLHGVAEEGHRELVELLIAKGANVNARDGGGRTPLWYAKDEGYTEIVELLRKHGAKE